MRFFRQPSSTLALIALLAGALALAGCGRKGGLDMPPGVSAAPAEGAAAAAEDESSISSAIIGNSKGNRRELPPPPSPKRSLPIDVLLN
jgi:predicted small lipoprotein YifL